MKIKLLAAVLILFCVFGNAAFGQKENYVWYFGDHAGLDFNSGSPVALTNGMLVTQEGCATISDANGNLLFYTNGVKVWDKNHNQMPNGNSLGGGNSSTQSALIVPFIGNNSFYYIFTVPDVGPNYFEYSVVDMSLNSGNGDITIKNAFITSQVTEKLSGVKYSNGIDTWVMIHKKNTNDFYCYLVSLAGISSTPVISSIGPVFSGADGTGYMKFSPDGTKIVFAAQSSNYVDLFDFNSTTGMVTNERYLTLPLSLAYGLEFSPTGHYLYCGQTSHKNIYQWDISSGSAVIINSTLQQIGMTAAAETDALQLGPDGKIYVTEYQENFLGIINYPDSSGVSCNYVDNAVSLGGKICRVGLPNFITSYFLPTGINTHNPEQNQLTVYPNPATDKITISFPSTTSGNITVKIYSVTGENLFQSFKTLEKVNETTIDVTGLSNGIYFLSMQTGREVVTRKVVVNH